MKGSLVVIKQKDPNLIQTAWLAHGIVMSQPFEVPDYSHDFLDGYRDSMSGEIHEAADPRLSRLSVNVFWPHSKVTSRHRLTDLEFLHMVG